ncbi:MAG: cation-translocating P-type ATPase [Chloroflexi bacterium]|nr:cation-translocating P-type ATPase [Chloroflexota bacterium]
MAVWHAMESAQVLKELDTDLSRGLSGDEVKRRLEQYGYNELKKEKGISPLTLFFHQFKDVLIAVLLVAIILSAAIGELMDAAIIAVIVVFSAVLGFTQEYRAERAVEALKKMLSPMITVLREGKEEEIPSKEVVPGDILLLEAGDRIPADARLAEIHSLRCDEAPLTGESAPVGKETGPFAEDAPLGERKNMAFTGTIVTYGRGKAVAVLTGMNTEFGKIAEQVATVETEKTPLEKRTAEIGKSLGIIALSICGVIIAVSFVRESFWSSGVTIKFVLEVVMFAVALAVAAVPEALAAIVTGALAIGMRQMAKRNALVKRMPAVETLGCTTVICSDKTGTLTKGEMTIRKIYTGGAMIEVTGAGYTPQGEFKAPGMTTAADNPSLKLLLQGGLLCNDSTLEERDGKWSIKGDPTEGALVVAAAKSGLHPTESRLKSPRVEEIPFSSDRKRMTTIHAMEDDKKVAFMKGAPEVVLEKCSSIMNGSGIKSLTAEERAKVLKVNEEMALDALRVLAVAYRELSQAVDGTEEAIERDMVLLGLTGMMDPPREEAMEATKTCKQVGIRPVMITGDHKLTAVAIAREIGFYQDGDMVLTGAELGKLPDEEFEKIVDKVTVYARVSPLDKLKIVKAWKTRGEVVAMTGDGVNDAPALKHADIGIAMGITGTDVTKEAADMVLSDDNFATIVKAIERGRWIYDNIKKYLAYLLQANIVEVIVIGGVVLALGPAFLPLLPAAILYMNLATDGLPALALGIAPPDPDIMQRPPRNPKASIFGWDVKSFILLAALVEAPFFFFIWFHGMDDIVRDRTDMFFLFIVVELVIAVNCRSLRFSVFKAPPHRWLLIAIVWELVLVAALVQIPAIRDAFGITIPTLGEIGLIITFGLAVFVLMEAVKALLRKRMALDNRH